MPIGSFFSDLFGQSKKGAKSKPGGIVNQTYLRRASAPSTISDKTIQRTNSDLTTIRNSATDKEVIQSYLNFSPDLSLAASSLARFAITDSYTVIAYSLDGKIDVAATLTANTIANRLDNLKPNYIGYSVPSDFRSLSESMIKVLNISGSFGSELVLGKGLVPERINVFSTRALKYEERNGTIVPYLVVNGANLYLESPLIDIQNLDLDPESPYSYSPYTAAIQPVIADQEFANDLRRAFRKANIPRVTAQIITEKWLDSLPVDTKFDPQKLKAAADSLILSIQSELNQLNPDDAIVAFDSLQISHLSAGNISSHEAAKEQRAMINARVSAGARTLPAILGRGESSSAASTESMIYLRMVEGIQEKLNACYSTHLTTAARLLGHDVYVKFIYASPELRPKSELSTFKATTQSIVLEQLSLGMISDEEASILITGTIPSGNYTQLSGTGFRSNTSIETTANPYSNTSVDGGINDTQAGKNNKAKNQKPSSNGTTGK